MNVCVLGCKSYPPHEYAGGIEINVWETTQRLRNKINFFIFTMHGKGKNVYTVPYISSHITRTPSYCLFAFKKIRELHRKIGFDLLHVHESWAGFFGGYFKKYLKCPLILTMHTIDSLQPEWKWVKFPFSLIERLAIRAADKVITPSYYIQSKLLQSRGLKHERSQIIPNGVDLKKFHRKGFEEKNSIIFIGRLTKSKNIITLIKAMRNLPNFNLYITGTGPLENKLRKLSPKNVKFLGFRRDIPTLLSRSEIYILPSISEGSPISLLEALAAGKPIVASAVGGIPEILGDAGILIAPTVEQIIKGIEIAQKRKDELSKKAILRARQFDWNKISKEICKIYMEYQS